MCIDQLDSFIDFYSSYSIFSKSHHFRLCHLAIALPTSISVSCLIFIFAKFNFTNVFCQGISTRRWISSSFKVFIYGIIASINGNKMIPKFILYKILICSSCYDSSILRLLQIQQRIYKQLWLASLLTRLVRQLSISNQPRITVLDSSKNPDKITRLIEGLMNFFSFGKHQRLETTRTSRSCRGSERCWYHDSSSWCYQYCRTYRRNNNHRHHPNLNHHHNDLITSV